MPEMAGGVGIRMDTFVGPLQASSLYALRTSATQGDLRHEAPTQSVTRTKPLASFRSQSTTIRVEPSSTDDSRLRGALPVPDSCGAIRNCDAVDHGGRHVRDRRGRAVKIGRPVPLEMR